MIMGMLNEVRRSLYGPEGCRGLMTEGSAADGPDADGRVVNVAPIHSPRNGPPGPHPLVGKPENEPKADKHGGNKAEGRNGEDGQPLLTHDAARWRTRPNDRSRVHPTTGSSSTSLSLAITFGRAQFARAVSAPRRDRATEQIGRVPR